MRTLLTTVCVTLASGLLTGAPMRTESNSAVVRDACLEAEFVVCGGGLAGVSAAVSAARHGVRTVLIQDRPVLGGNASSEMRMGIVGVHGEDFQETGILEELQLDNFFYNPLQRYTLWDDVIASLVRAETNIVLLLNTSVDGVEMAGARIASVRAWNSNAYTRYCVKGRLFADCTGDGILRLSGARFRRGREFPGEFGETFLQKGGDHRTMGNSILMQLRKTAEHHPFVPPPWAHRFTDADFAPDTEPPPTSGVYKIHMKRPYPNDNNFWWIEYGGNLDTIADANEIQRELKRIAYGVWAYMKNHPDGRAREYELDWIGSLPGKRESTRFVGPHVLTQADILAGGCFEDVVAYGGWSLDDHHPDAFYRKGRISVEYACPQGFGIPFDCLYSVNVPNLLFAGRDISATHMGLSATRVMATCALLGQAVGTAAGVASRHRCEPAAVRGKYIAELQATLEDDDVLLPGRRRSVSALTASATGTLGMNVLRNGMDRRFAGEDNGLLLSPGQTNVVWSWSSPQRIGGARLVFDSVLKERGKRMRKLEATTERVTMPAPLAKAFRLEARVGGVWTTVFSDKTNHRRLRKVRFDPVTADALRLVVESAWGGDRAHVFAFDALGGEK